MSKVDPIPPGHHAVTPHLVVRGAAKALDFYARALGAVEVMRMPAPGGEALMHAEMLVGNSMIYLADESPEWAKEFPSPQHIGGTTVGFNLYVRDCDAAFARAVEAGAEVIMPLQDMFWGDRMGMVRDPFGHRWTFATRVKEVSPEEMAKAAEAWGGCGDEKA